MDMLRFVFTKTLPVTKSLRQLCISSTSIASTNFHRRECGSSFIHTTGRRFDLYEFFDLDDFDVDEVKVGRPWRKEELRIKSNTDLHKLWYVLLKERNLLMTMEHMYRSELEALPSPERFEKVEESMENLQDVVRERDIAYKLLEKGEIDEPKSYITRNAIGIPYKRTETEHYIPKEINERFNLMHPEKEGWMDKYLALYEEKIRRQRDYAKTMHQKKREEILEEFEMDEEEIPELPDVSGDKLQEYLENTSELKDINHEGR